MLKTVWWYDSWWLPNTSTIKINEMSVIHKSSYNSHRVPFIFTTLTSHSIHRQNMWKKTSGYAHYGLHVVDGKWVSVLNSYRLDLWSIKNPVLSLFINMIN